MTILAITRDGKITLPKELLEHLGIPSGGRIDVSLWPDRQVRFQASLQQGEPAGTAAKPRGGQRGRGV